MTNEGKGIRNVLPMDGIWTVEDLAIYLEIDAPQLMIALSEFGIPTAAITRRPKHKLIRMCDVAKAIEKGRFAVKEDVLK